MNLSKIRLTGREVIDFPIENLTPAHPYIVKDVTGLGPAEIDVFVSDLAYGGGFYQGRRSQPRDMVLTCQANPDYAAGLTPGDLRAKVYNMLGVLSERILISLFEGEVEAMRTYGHIYGVDAIHFGKDTLVQIKLRCPNPYFDAPNQISLLPSAGLTGSDPVVVNYTGQVPVGLIVRGEMNGAVEDAFLRITNSQGTQQLKVVLPLALNEDVAFNTIPGQRTVSKYKDSPVAIAEPILYAINAGGVWPMLHPGPNTVTLDASFGSIDWVYLRYTPQYWGA